MIGKEKVLLYVKRIYTYIFIIVIILISTYSKPLSADENFENNFKIENGFMHILDEPAYKFKFDWAHWSYATATNPFILVYNTAIEGMIAVIRLPVGKTLPFGKTPIEENIDTDSIEKLMMENLENREVELIVGSSTKVVSGKNAVIIIYSFEYKSKMKMAVECGFLYEDCFFYINCSANQGTAWQKAYAAFMTITDTIIILNQEK
jgi:hypothetical protein